MDELQQMLRLAGKNDAPARQVESSPFSACLLAARRAGLLASSLWRSISLNLSSFLDRRLKLTTPYAIPEPRAIHRQACNSIFKIS